MSSEFSNYPSHGEYYYKDILWNDHTSIKVLEKVEKFKFLSTDILLATYPRSGTTVSQEIIWHIKNKDIIKKSEKYGSLVHRFPFLEYNTQRKGSNAIISIDLLRSRSKENYRLIKTHCPFKFLENQLISGKPKIILVMRNPRDVCVSFYHFMRGSEMYGPWQGSWDQFVEMFCAGYVQNNSWKSWYEQWWDEMNVGTFGNEPVCVETKQGLSVLLYSYEMLIKSPALVIEKIAQFLDENLTDEQTDIILHNSDFKTMSENTALNFTDKTGFQFLRKGQIGDWKEMFNETQLMKFQNEVETDLIKKGFNFSIE